MSEEKKTVSWSDLSPQERRNAMGEAHVMCNDCGARLFSEEGVEDRGMRCPYVGQEAVKMGCKPNPYRRY